MTDDESAEASAQAKKNEAIFPFRVGIVSEDGAIVVEDGFGLLRGNVMLPFIGRGLSLVPFEPRIRHELEL